MGDSGAEQGAANQWSIAAGIYRDRAEQLARSWTTKRPDRENQHHGRPSSPGSWQRFGFRRFQNRPRWNGRSRVRRPGSADETQGVVSKLGYGVAEID